MKKRGFTLVELVVTISIISILLAFVLTVLGGQRAQTRDGKRLAESDGIRKALEIYYIEHRVYPEPEGGDWVCIEESSNFSSTMSSYFPAIPSDPLYPQQINGHKYCYYYNTKDTTDQDYKLYIKLENGTDYILYSMRGKDIPLP